MDDLLRPRVKRIRTGIVNLAKMPGTALIRNELNAAAKAMDAALRRLEQSDEE